MFADLKQLTKLDIQTSDIAVVQKNNVCFISDFDETLFKNKVKRNK